MMPFFNRNWAGACGGCWARPGSMAGWSVGSWIVGVEVGLLQCWSAGSGRGTLMKKQERRGGGGGGGGGGGVGRGSAYSRSDA